MCLSSLAKRREVFFLHGSRRKKKKNFDLSKEERRERERERDREVCL